MLSAFHPRAIWAFCYKWYHEQNFDNYIMIALIMILSISLSNQYAVGEGSFFYKHLIYILMGLPVFYLGYKLDWKYLNHWVWIFYGLGIILLIWVLLKGTTSLGAQRWITVAGFSLQPSEPAKLACILALAYWYIDKVPNTLVELLRAGFSIIFIPFLLIFLQPDLGTSLVMIMIFTGISLWAGAKIADLMIIFNPLLIMILSSIGFVWHLGSIDGLDINASIIGVIYIILIHWYFYYAYCISEMWRERGILFCTNIIFSLLIAFVMRPFAWNILAPYQQKRLTIFLNPYSDPYNAGYNVIQSMTAVGNGGIIGNGYNSGILTEGLFVPEQHTDFIFSAWAEQTGFIGVLILLICFGVILYRTLLLASKAKDRFEVLLLIGIMAYLLFHIAVNISMNMSLMPVTGVPLPFMSYGGTAMWMNLFCIGIIQGIYARRVSMNYFRL